MENIPGSPGPGTGAPAAQQQVSVPAILLMVTGVLVALNAVLQMIRGSGKTLEQMPPQLFEDPNMAPLRSFIEWMVSYGWIFGLIGLAWGGLIFYGGLQMKNLRNYGLAIAASILAAIPCFTGCCCFIGIPAGIWALIVLSKPEVKTAFR